MKKRALIITSIPYSPSNRGIDIITEALGEMSDFEVTHLTFATKRYVKKFSQYNHEAKGVRHLYLRQSSLSYLERLMHAWPDVVVRWINKRSLNKINFDFSSYDLIVVESGKPVLLLPLMPDSATIIYRCSDPMPTLFTHPEILQWEVRMLKRADFVITVRDLKRLELGSGYTSDKTTVIYNGFNISMDISGNRDDSPQYGNKGDLRNLVYVGYTTLDGGLLVRLAKEIPNAQLHIIGECLIESDKKLVSNEKRIHLYGNLPSSEYLEIVRSADVAIMPFKKEDRLSCIGMNSKFLMMMAFNLPIVSRELGYQDEFPPSRFISFQNDDEAFVSEVRRMLEYGNKQVDYNIDLYAYSRDGRIEEYQRYFSKIIMDINNLEKSDD